MKDDMVSRREAIDALWKALYEYEDETEKQFQESKDLDVGDWILHRIFVQNMNDIDRQTILNMPSAQQWIPCKTELPDDDTEVIVSCTDDSGDGEFSYVTTGWHYKGLWVVNNDRCYFVKAWQPLPAKPWEGEQDESDD